MTETEHKDRHKLLHEMLDELVADFLSCDTKLYVKDLRPLSEITVLELMLWSSAQANRPAHPK